MLTFCEQGDRVVLESASHVLTSEAFGIADVAGLEPHSLWAPDGRMDPDAVGELVAESRAVLLILENTHTRAGGTTLSAELTEALADAARAHDCRIHIDGARLVNASVALDSPLAALAAPANSIALSLNKGLSAPMGTVLAGSEAVVGRARTMLERLGGATVHKAGIPAAAGLVALDTTFHGIADDHRRARALGARLAAIPGVRLEPGIVETNIVLLDVSGTGLLADGFAERLAAEGVRVMARDTSRVRFVTHRLIGEDEVEETALAVARVAEDAIGDE
jgi:threonine aldolase